MKLADWARKQGISYLTAYRWFKDGKLPANAYQSESGTIIVQDDDLEASEQAMNEETSAVAHFLKKTIEYSKANSSIEDFAAFILSNYKLEMQSSYFEKPSKRVKPTQEMTSSHFQKFLQKSQKPQPNMLLMDKESLEQIISNDLDPNLSEKLKKANIVEQPFSKSIAANAEVNLMVSEMQKQLGNAPAINAVHTYDAMTAGVFSRADSQINGSVVDSTAPAFNSFIVSASPVEISTIASNNPSIPDIPVVKVDEMPSPEDLEAWRQIFEAATADKDFKIFTHAAVNLNHTVISYDKARELVNRMVEVGLLKTNDPLIMDRQAKEICNWTQDAFDSMSQVVDEAASKSDKKVAKKRVSRKRK